MVDEILNAGGLTTDDVQRLQAICGKNELTSEKKISFFKKVLDIITAPMFMLLIAAATIYFILGEPVDGLVMLAFVVLDHAVVNVLRNLNLVQLLSFSFERFKTFFQVVVACFR